MNGLIPVEDAIEENFRVKDLENQRYLIKPIKIEEYLNDFKNPTTKLNI